MILDHLFRVDLLVQLRRGQHRAVGRVHHPRAPFLEPHQVDGDPGEEKHHHEAEKTKNKQGSAFIIAEGVDPAFQTTCKERREP